MDASPRRAVGGASAYARREDGALALDQMDLVTVSGLDTYSQPKFGVAFRAARTDTPPTEL